MPQTRLDTLYRASARSIDVTLEVYHHAQGRPPYGQYTGDPYYQSMLSLYEAAMDLAEEEACL